MRGGGLAKQGIGRSPMKRLSLVFAVLAILAPACGGGGSDDSEPAAQEEPSPEETTPPFESSDDSAGSAACLKGPKGKTEIELTQVDVMFKPEKLKAPAGEMVTVVVSNEGGLEHTFTSPDVDCDSGYIAPGTKATVTFEMPDAAVEFYCVPHKPSMNGEIVPT
jgi:plastocyanin